MCKFSSKSGGVPFQISFFGGDLTRNDPMMLYFMIGDIICLSIKSIKKNSATPQVHIYRYNLFIFS